MSNDYCFGLTASRHGMSGEQKTSFRDYLAGSVGILHHGMCIGGDADGHHIAREIGYFIVGHPPTNESLMATDLHCEEIWPAKPYLDRNKDIAKCGHALIAVPSEPEEQPRGGTWSTVRYARKIGRAVILILPNGKIIQAPAVASTMTNIRRGLHMTEHTPTPWEIRHRLNSIGDRNTGGRWVIAQTGTSMREDFFIAEMPFAACRSADEKEHDANAAFIVKAVNNHAPMVAELQRLYEKYGHQATADVLASVSAPQGSGK